MTSRAYADAGPSVRHAERPEPEEAAFVKEEAEVESESESEAEAESETSVEASGGEEEGAVGKKKKPRSGFRDRKVINNPKDPAHQPAGQSDGPIPCRVLLSRDLT